MGFVLQQRRHLLFRRQAGHGNGVIVLQGLSVAGNAGELVAAVVLFYLHGNTADHRQRAAVERGKAALAPFHKGAQGVL